MMKRIQKGPVRGISLKLQEEVAAPILNYKGTRTQDGLHPRAIGTAGRKHQHQGRERAQDDPRVRNPQAGARHEEAEGPRMRLKHNKSSPTHHIWILLLLAFVCCIYRPLVPPFPVLAVEFPSPHLIESPGLVSFPSSILIDLSHFCSCLMCFLSSLSCCFTCGLFDIVLLE